MTAPEKRLFDMAEIHAHPCPNLLYDLLAAGRLNEQGKLEVPASVAETILAACPDPGLRGLGDVVAIVAPPAVTQRAAINVQMRMGFCAPCAWNVSNKCQHPAQSCAPCKQGRGLQAALARSSFTCPLKNF
jgi:hypothetical protein